MKKKILFTVITLAYLLATAYYFWRIYPVVLSFGIIGEILFYGVAFLNSCAIFTFFGIGERLPVLISAWLYKVGTGWLILIIYGFIAIMCFDILSVVNNLVLKSTHSLLVYRTQMQGSFIILFTSFCALWGFMTYRNKERQVLNLYTKKPLAHPLKIVLLSDMHLGYAIEQMETKKWVELINKEQPDLVVIAGDVVDFSLKPVVHYNLSSILKNIKSKYGVYACLGNHEYLAGVQQSLDFLEKSNITVLRDRSIYIEQLNVTLIGRDDKSNTKRAELAHLIPNNSHTSLSILLDHQPYALQQAVDNAIDIQFSGHTHRGQVWPVNWITDYLFENSHGYLKKQDTQFYVSSGIGIWGGRYRVGSKSEYVVVQVTNEVK